MDITKVENIAQLAYKIYKKDAIHIQSAEKLEPIEKVESQVLPQTSPQVSVGGNAELPIPVETSHPLTKIQSGSVYIQIPQDDLNSIDFAIQALQFMRQTVQQKTTQKTAETKECKSA